MTTVIPCVMHHGGVKVLDMNRLNRWKEAHKQGEHFDMILEDGGSNALSPMAKKYYSIRDDYAHLNGYDKKYAHIELKYLFGVWYPYESPPKNRSVRLVEAYGELCWQLSLKEYDNDELAALVDLSQVALTEASV